MITQSVFRLAVPYFFVCSGFFLGKKLACGDDCRQVTVRHIKRWCIPLFFYEFLNLAFELWKASLEGRLQEYTVSGVIRHLLFYPYGAMWYLQASVVGCLLLYPFLRRGKCKAALPAALLLYIFALFCNNYYFLLNKHPLERAAKLYLDIFLSARNGVFVGFLFLTLGVLCASVYDRRRPGLRRSLCLLAAALGCCFLEIMMLWNKPYADDGALYVSHVLLAPALLLALLQTDVPISAGFSQLMRKLSAGLYFVHRLLLVLLSIILTMCRVKLPGCFQFVIVVAAGCALCMGMYRIQRKPVRYLFQ